MLDGNDDIDDDMREAMEDIFIDLADTATVPLNLPSQVPLVSTTTKCTNSLDYISQNLNPSIGNNVNKYAAGPLYEQEFLEIWLAFTRSETCRIAPMTSIDPSRHLMSTCLENLIPFCRWARDAANHEWIRSKLDYDGSLRPKVRNGLALILIYVFASGQAAASHGDIRTANIVQRNMTGKQNHLLQILLIIHHCKVTD